MQKTRRKILRQAKTYFSDAEYKKYFRAIKTLELHNVSLDHTLEIQNTLFTVLPEFDVLYASLFIESTQISASITNRLLNARHKGFLKEVSLFQSLNILEPSSEKQLLQLLFEAFTKKPKIIYFFLSEQLAISKKISSYSLDFQVAYAKRLFAVVAPLAKRMGVRTLREKFETIAFSLLFADDYNSIAMQRSRYIKEEKLVMRKITEKIRYYLKKEGLKFQVLSRVKGMYSIYKKLKKKGRSDIAALRDIFALRIIVNSVGDCYKVLGILHQKFPHIAGKIKDYISLPKPNSYQSLHTILKTVVNENVLPFEVQIRTEEMDKVANAGMAAHFFYKQNDKVAENPKKIKKKIALLSKKLSSKTFLQHAEADIFEKYIFIFTAHNHIFPLEKGDTVLDFAFLIHTDLGLKAEKIFVNQEQVSFDRVLQNGERVEVVAGEDISIEQDWKKKTHNPKVHKKIDAFFSKKQ